MAASAKRKTSLTLDIEALEAAKELKINVSSVAEAALINAIAEARRKRWLAENTGAFAAQSDWHERHGHPLADIITSHVGTSWSP
ncbi:type II toxin-antitoxin system CcdA family antitoxin [Roseovarius sp. D22-M7]|uniref:type II toxin-antitoxin system CcdA family antitoxin n=1 Tax=Roseovarius sp. D22-M7 TaxID=3127116 RepID=UPI00300FEE6F